MPAAKSRDAACIRAIIIVGRPSRVLRPAAALAGFAALCEALGHKTARRDRGNSRIGRAADLRFHINGSSTSRAVEKTTSAKIGQPEFARVCQSYFCVVRITAQMCPTASRIALSEG